MADESMSGEAMVAANGGGAQVEVEFLRRQLAEAQERVTALIDERNALVERSAQLEQGLHQIREEATANNEHAVVMLESLRLRVEALEQELDNRQLRLAQIEQALTATEEAVVRREHEVMAEVERARTATEQIAAQAEARLDQILAEAKHQAELYRQRETELTLAAEAARREHEQREQALRSELAAAGERIRALEQALAERDGLIAGYQEESRRRGAPGSPQAVRTAVGDMAKVMRERKRRWLALTQPWRLPPGTRG